MKQGLALLFAAAALVAACGKPPAPKIDAATERAEATERARKDVFGTQVKALESAKAMGADVNKKAQENVDAIEKMAK